MKKFQIKAIFTVSGSCVVKANSLKEAIETAEEMNVRESCYGCTRPPELDGEENCTEWVLDIDGVPQEIEEVE